MINKIIFTINTKLAKNHFRLSVLFLIIATIYSLFYCFYGLDFTDSFFYINSISRASEYPLWIGTTSIGNFVYKFIGQNLIHFRIANWMAYLLAAILPFLILLPISIVKKNLAVLAVIILWLNLLSFNIFGIDGLTILFVSISYIFFSRYMLRKLFVDLLLSAFLSAIVIAVRTPNIIILPIFLTFIGLSYWFEPKFKKNIFIFLKPMFLYLFFSLTLLTIFYVSFFKELNFFNQITSYFSHNLNGSYNPSILIGGYLTGYKELLKYIGLVILFLLVAESNYFLAFKRQKLVIQLIAIVSFLIFLKYEFMVDVYTRKSSMFISAIAIVTIIHLILTSFANKNKQTALSLLLILAISIISIFGSNTGLLKLAPLLVVFASIMLVKHEIKLSKFTYLLIIILTIFFSSIKMSSIYEDAPLKELNSKANPRQISNIFTTPIRADLINSVIEHYDSIAKNTQNIIFWGGKSHIFHFLTSTTTLYNNSFWMMPDDIAEINRVEQMVKTIRPIVFFISEYPSKENAERKTTHFEKMLIENNYKFEKRFNYSVFHPQ